MKKFYTATGHNVIKALTKADVSFPISKKDLMDKAGKCFIQVDFDNVVTLEELCKGIKISDFYNKSQFYCALIGSTLKL